MSVQSDCELLYIMALENYSKKYSVSQEVTNKLFVENQVFEKMIIQHEYLHQVSFEEVEEFVEKIISDNSKDIVVFHGSCFDFDKIDLSMSRNRRDFGKGFYTTSIERQAKEWGYHLSLRENKDKYFVYVYQFTETPDLKIKRFDTLNIEWLEFIKKNRLNGGVFHDYDVVIGAVADDRTMETVQLYMANVLTSQEAIERLKYFKVNNQISFHTDKAISHLKLVRRDEYGNNLHL